MSRRLDHKCNSIEELLQFNEEESKDKEGVDEEEKGSVAKSKNELRN